MKLADKMLHRRLHLNYKSILPKGNKAAAKLLDTLPPPCYYGFDKRKDNNFESEEYPVKRVLESRCMCWNAGGSATGEWAEELSGRTGETK